METLIAKTILSVTPMIDEVRRAICQKNNSLAISSMSNTYDTYEIVERILENIDRSAELNNLKVRVTEYVETMPKKLAQVIKLRFFERQSTEQIAPQMKLSTRSVFRLSCEAVKHFANNLKKIDLDYFGFKKLIWRNKWIYGEFKRQELLAA